MFRQRGVSLLANLRAIRTRIKSVESTRQITKSMKMVAAAKLRKTQQASAALRRFAGMSQALLRSVPADPSNPYLRQNGEGGKTCYVLIVGNRGLCGTYNQALLRWARERMEPDSLLVVCGRWGRDQIGPSERSFEISDAPTAEEAKALSGYLKGLFLEGKADRIVLLYQGFASVLKQEPAEKTLLPLALPAAEETGTGWLYEPDRKTVTEALVEQVLDSTVHSVLLEARTGEHAARMTAMTAATDNTEELIGELTLELNHARQAAITTEISEIVGGAAAL